MITSRMKAIQEEKRIAEQGGTSSRRNFYNEALLDQFGIKKIKLEQGSHFFAVVPPKDPNSYFGVRCSVHYGVGPANDAFLCPLEMKRERCPICEERQRLEAQLGGSEDDSLKKIISSLRPSLRYLFFGIDMKNKDSIAEGIQMLEAAFSIQQGIVSVSTNPRTGEVIDISDPAEGKTFHFKRTGKGQFDTRYTDFRIEDREPLKQEWLDAIPDFNQVLNWADYGQILEVFQGGDSPKKEDLGEKLQTAMGLDVPSTPAPAAPVISTPSQTQQAPVQQAPVQQAPVQQASTTNSAVDRLAAIRAAIAAKQKK